MEVLELGVRVGFGFLRGRRLRLGDWLGSGVTLAAHLRDRVDGRIGASEDSWTEERLGRSDQARGGAERCHGLEIHGRTGGERRGE